MPNLAHTKTVNISNPEALFNLIKQEHPPARSEIRKYMKTTQQDINARNEKGYSALHIATITGNNELVKILLELHADIDQIAHNGNTSLHIAASFGYHNIIITLLNNDASTTIKNSFSLTAEEFSKCAETRHLFKLHRTGQPLSTAYTVTIDNFNTIS